MRNEVLSLSEILKISQKGQPPDPCPFLWTLLEETIESMIVIVVNILRALTIYSTLF